MYTYTWYQWMTFFYFYCFFGWIFESGYVSAKNGHFVNRGFLRLPMLPLYGSGAVMMLWVSIPVHDSLILTWCAGVIGATLLEYVTGYVMEQLFKVRYWDYSDQKWNIHGYICLSSSIAWGFLTIFMTHVIHKPIERGVLSMPAMWDILFVVVVTVVFVYDSVVCVREALAFGKSLEAMKKLRQDLDNLHVQSALLKMEAKDRIQEARSEFFDQMAAGYVRASAVSSVTNDRLEELKAIAGGTLDNLKDLKEIHLDGLRGKTEQQLAELLKEKEAAVFALKRSNHRFRRNRLHSNPTAASRMYAQEFKDMKDYLERTGKGQSPQ